MNRTQFFYKVRRLQKSIPLGHLLKIEDQYEFTQVTQSVSIFVYYHYTSGICDIVACSCNSYQETYDRIVTYFKEKGYAVQGKDIES